MTGKSAAPVSGATRFTAFATRARLGACCRAVACGTSATAHAMSNANRTTFFNAVGSFVDACRRHERSTTLGNTRRRLASRGLARRGRSAVWLCAYRLKVASRSAGCGTLGERSGHFRLERGDQTFAFGQETPPVDEAGVDAVLDGFDECGVLPTDPVVEGDQVARPGLVHVGREEVVEEAHGPSGSLRPDRPDREVGEAGVAVDLQ